jgi:hypothetical protein
MRLYIFTFLVLFLPALVSAKGHDSNYVQLFPQTVTARIYTGEKFAIFDLHDNKTGHTLQYRPNNGLTLGAGITIFGIGLNLSFPMPFHDRKFEEYGRTRQLDLQLHSYQPKIMLDAYFQRYRGFHLASSETVSQVKGDETYPYFPRMHVTTVSLSALYVFNGDQYSMRAAINQQTRQLKSAGSFLLGVSGYTHTFDDDSSILYQYNKYPEIFEGRMPRKLTMSSLSLQGGYGYNYVFDRKGRWFIGAAADLGVGVTSVHSTDVNLIYGSRTSLNLAANVRFGAGFNNEKWFAGVFATAHTDSYRLPYADAFMTASQGVARLTVARRFVTRKRFLAKQPGDKPLFDLLD